MILEKHQLKHIFNHNAKHTLLVLLLLTFSPQQKNGSFTVTAFSTSSTPTQSRVRNSGGLSPALFNNEQLFGLVGTSSQISSTSRSVDSSERVTARQMKKKLSRPERKALERQAKEEQTKKQGRSNRGHRHHNFEAYNKQLDSRYDSKNEGPYDLHSRAVSSLSKNSTADDVMRAIKRAQNLHDVHDIANVERFLLEEVDEHFAYGYRGSLLARLAVAALHMSNHELARKALEVRRIEHRSSMMPMESAAIIRGLLRVHNVTDAIAILDDELHLPLKGLPLDTPEARDRIIHRSSAIASIVSRHFFELEPYMAVKACKMLAEMGPVVREAGLKAKDVKLPWKRLLRGAAHCETERRASNICPTQVIENVDLPVNLVYSVLNAMTTFPPENKDDIYEVLSNALVRRTNFVTGAVSLESMPKADRGEAVFIGRSNVGKSSLVNMVSEFCEIHPIETMLCFSVKMNCSLANLKQFLRLRSQTANH